MNDGYYAIDVEWKTQFTEAERERERDRQTDGQTDRQTQRRWSEGCIQHSDVVQHLTPDWCDVAERGRAGAGLTSMITPPHHQHHHYTSPNPILHPTLPPVRCSRPWQGSIRGDQWRQKLKIDRPARKEGNGETCDGADVDTPRPQTGCRWFLPSSETHFL